MDQLLVYFSTPYSHEDPDIVRARYLECCYITELVIREVPGIVPITAIAYTHQFAHIENIDWLARMDYRLLDACDAAMVVKMDGWSDSRGISREIQYCSENDISVFYSKPERIVAECRDMLDVVSRFVDQDTLTIRRKLMAGLRFFCREEK